MVVTRNKTGSMPANKGQAAVQEELQRYSSNMLLTFSPKKPSIASKSVPQINQTSPLLNLSLETLSLILLECPIKSLIDLSRTSRDLRAFLKSKNSRHVWAAARERIACVIEKEDFGITLPLGTYKLPNPPDWLSELAYAVLISTNECSFCGGPDSSETGITWNGPLLARTCLSCYYDHFSTFDGLYERKGKRSVDRRFCAYLPQIIKATVCKSILDRLRAFSEKYHNDQTILAALHQRAAAEHKDRCAFADGLSLWSRACTMLDYAAGSIDWEDGLDRFQRNLDFTVDQLRELGMDATLTDCEYASNVDDVLYPLEYDITLASWPQIFMQLTASTKLLQVIDLRKVLFDIWSPETIELRKRVTAMLQLLYSTQGVLQHSKWPRIKTNNFDQLSPGLQPILTELRRDDWQEKLPAIVAEWGRRIREAVDLFFETQHARIFGSEFARQLYNFAWEYDPAFELRRLFASASDTDRSDFLLKPNVFFRCQRGCREAQRLTFSEVFEHICFQRLSVDRQALEDTLEAALDFGYDTDVVMPDGLPQTHTVFTGNKDLVTINICRWATGEDLLRAIREAQLPAPATQEQMLALKGTFRCRDCPSSSPFRRTGGDIASFWNYHEDLLSDNGTKRAWHSKFYYEAADEDLPMLSAVKENALAVAGQLVAAVSP